MPYKNIALSQNEKNTIINRHKELVNELNTFLGNDPRDAIVETNMDSLLNKPEYIATYRFAEEMKEIKNQQMNILNDYTANKKLSNPDDAKWLVHIIRTEATKEANDYNKKLFEDYEKNPNQVKAMFFKKALTFNPVKLMKLGDNKNKLIEFYRENHEIIDLANELSNSSNASFLEGLNPEFKKAIEELSEPLSVIGYPAKLAVEARNPDFFAMPELNERQASIIVTRADSANKEFAPIVRDYLEALAGKDLTACPGEYFFKIKEKCRVKINSDFLTNYYAQDENDDEVEIADFTDVLKDKGDAAIFKRKGFDAFKVRCVNKDFMDKYSKKWQESFAKKQNVKGDFNAKKILDNYKGNIVEKYILRSTSKQYKEFEKAFEDYNNPESKDYLNKDRLREKSNAYLKYKFKGKDVDLSKLSGTSLKRATLVQNTLTTLDEEKSLERNVENDLNKGYPLEDNSFLVTEDLEEVSPDKILVDEKRKQYVQEDEIEFERIEM